MSRSCCAFALQRVTHSWGRVIFHVEEVDRFWAYMNERELNPDSQEMQSGARGSSISTIRMAMSYRLRNQSPKPAVGNSIVMLLLPVRHPSPPIPKGFPFVTGGRLVKEGVLCLGRRKDGSGETASRVSFHGWGGFTTG